MTIPYCTTKFTSANIFVSAALDQTTKFKDRQHFRLYGIIVPRVHTVRELIHRSLSNLVCPLYAVGLIGFGYSRFLGTSLAHNWQFQELYYSPAAAAESDIQQHRHNTDTVHNTARYSSWKTHSTKHRQLDLSQWLILWRQAMHGIITLVQVFSLFWHKLHMLTRVLKVIQM